MPFPRAELGKKPKPRRNLRKHQCHCLKSVHNPNTSPFFFLVPKNYPDLTQNLLGSSESPARCITFPYFHPFTQSLPLPFSPLFIPISLLHFITFPAPKRGVFSLKKRPELSNFFSSQTLPARFSTGQPTGLNKAAELEVYLI